MSRAGHLVPLVLLAVSLGASACGGRPREPRDAPAAEPALGTTGQDTLRLSLDYLAREVPSWREENGCFSCHHNGDAARALFAARRFDQPVPASAFAGTLEWLSLPERWDEQKGDPGLNDRTLATLQFAAALAGAVEAGLIDDKAAIARAAETVVSLQAADGAWPIEPRDSLGSPATWGTHLATALACRTLMVLHPGSDAFQRAWSWLKKAPIRNVLEAAAVLYGLDASPERTTDSCLTLIESSQARGGGWGPYPNVPAEPFDTAVVLLALSRLPRGVTFAREWVRDGRAFLLSTRNPYGGWPATTRPRGGESYAQATSTTAWAVLALLATRAD